MAITRVFLSGKEFVEKVLAGERDFSFVRLEPGFDPESHEQYDAFKSALAEAASDGDHLTLTGAAFRSIGADGLTLRSMEARGASFKAATLLGANLEEANLENADLRHATLATADLSHANLRNADLRCANFMYARLIAADLAGANVEAADLEYANMQRADLKDLRNLDRAKGTPTVNFNFAQLTEQEKAIIRMELWSQQMKKFRTFGGTG